MRVKVIPEDLQLFLQAVKNSRKVSWDKIAQICNVHPRTIRDWRRGRFTVSFEALKTLSEVSRIKLPRIQEQLSDYWYVNKGAKKGALKRQELYGNLGTPEGRRLGGLRSFSKNRLINNSAWLPREIKIPRRSALLAEYIGIVLGDGGITPYQVTVTLHKHDDKEYIRYVSQLSERLFGVRPSTNFRERYPVCSITTSRIKLVSFLNKAGLPVGNKVRQQVMVPAWIERNKTYSKACIRGLIDTDGCFYVDKHNYKDKVYYNACLNFTNRSMPVLHFCQTKLEGFGFHPTRRTKYSVFLRRENEIARYFKVIGSSNPKHTNKYINYYKKRYGEVPKWP